MKNSSQNVGPSISHKFDEIEKNGYHICNQRPRNSRKKVVQPKKFFGCSQCYPSAYVKHTLFLGDIPNVMT